MGLLIERERFSSDEFESFSQRLAECLEAFEALLARPGFGRGEVSVGAELELSLVDETARPLPINSEVIEASGDPRLTVELDRFNLECNLRHGPLGGRPFRALRREFESALRTVRTSAAGLGGRAVMIGILPTLESRDLGSSAMTQTPRFRALSAALLQRRSDAFHLRIHGDDPLDLRCDDVTFEGAATSMQVHLRVDVEDFARVYNALQLVTAPALAVAGNSPTFLGHRLWEETRVALFKQAVDDRPDLPRRGVQQARVGFGTGWVEGGALELFTDSVEQHEPLLPVLSDESPLAVVRGGGVPLLEELRLHAGTVWRWNRPVFDPADGGHLRIEMRALPAGPTVTDMLANTAFLVGASLGLAPRADALCSRLDFARAHHNFYRAAQSGLAARLAWPTEDGGAAEEIGADALVERLVDVAAAGLRSASIEEAEFAPLLEVVAERARSGQTGARWQRHAIAQLEKSGDRRSAMQRMLEAYVARSEEDRPVHSWSGVEE